MKEHKNVEMKQTMLDFFLAIQKCLHNYIIHCLLSLLSHLWTSGWVVTVLDDWPEERQTSVSLFAIWYLSGHHIEMLPVRFVLIKVHVTVTVPLSRRAHRLTAGVYWV